MSILPLDIIEMITDILASEDDFYLSSTKACALVCRNFLAICRKRLFARIVLNDFGRYVPKPMHGWQQSATTSMLKDLLKTSPGLAYHIRDLDYCLTSEDLRDFAAVAEMFSHITRLDALFIRDDHTNSTPSPWDNPLRPALLRLLHLPSLVDFNLYRFTDFHFNDLSPCRLQKFGFDTLHTSTTSSPPPGSSLKLGNMDVGPFSSSTVLNICTAPIIDFDHLTQLSIRSLLVRDLEAAFHFIGHCKQLNSLSLYNAQNWTPELKLNGLSTYLGSSSQTLKHLEVHMLYDDDVSEDQFCGLSDELEKIAHKNVIEQVFIEVCIQFTSGCDRGDEWGRWDRAMGTGWPRLRQFVLIVDFSGDSPVASGLEEALMRVRETQFPRLSANKSLDFDFVIQDRSAAPQYRIEHDM